jgi:hypothetical protein
MPQQAGTFVAGDVTGKAIWAVPGMAGTCALLEAPAPPPVFLGAVPGQVSDRLGADIPARMFLTCFALVLGRSGGEIESANAGHGVRYVRSAGGVASGTVHRRVEPARVRVRMTGGGR